MTETPRSTPRALRTTITGVLILLVTVPFALSAVDLWRVGFGTLDEQTTLRLVAFDWDPENAGIFLRLAAVTMAATCVWGVVVGLGVLARVETMRLAGLLTFSAFSLLTVLLSLGALTSAVRPDGWLLALVVAGVNVTITVLLWSTEVADDIARGAHERAQRRNRRRTDVPG